MHEASVTRDIVRHIEQVAAEQGARHVVGVKIVLGPLSGFSASSLREHFTHDAEGTVAQGARIEVRVAGKGHGLEPLAGVNASGVLLESIVLGPGGGG